MTALSNTFKVAIFDEFLESFAKIPRAQQKKVNKFIRQFRANPTASSINYESISTFVDPNLRTVRIDQAYRAIVLKPTQGNIFVLLWVDNHDEAMDWARRKRFDIHPETGALQVITSSAIDAAAAPPAAIEPTRPPLFDGVRDRELLRLGVPDALLPAVRQVVAPSGLDTLQSQLPEEAWEALFFLSEGESLEAVERALSLSVPENVDTADFVAAIERPDSQRRFVFVEDDETLEAMLDAPLEKWRTFLHPSQRRLVSGDKSGPTRVLGGAGTGKTVVAMHRAAWLLNNRFNQPGDRVLFTTFTKNLAQDIHDQFGALVPPDAFRRMEVVHIDGWVSELLKGAGYGRRIAYFGRSGPLQRHWDAALGEKQDDRSDKFYRDEWVQVVQTHGCRTWDDYKSAPRNGRGVRMSRRQRKQVWAVFEAYRARLDDAGLREPEDALRDAIALVKSGEINLRYKAILVDEAQDMSTAAFELLRAIVSEAPNDLFIVGDGHQRIYRRRVVLSRAGVKIVGRSHRLRINYRTTEEIRARAVALLEGAKIDDMDGGEDTTQGYTSLMHGAAPTVRFTTTLAEEIAALVEWLRQGKPEGACVVARTQKLRDRYGDALRTHGFEICLLDRETTDDRRTPGVRLATMHRVKGLEFDRVAIVGLAAGDMPSRWAVEQYEDPLARADAELMERSLLYVAMTRARRSVLLTASGTPCRWLV